jgi:adenylate kinase family enzyme
VSAPQCELRRIRVVGTSGSGKSHLATRIADQLNLGHIELDALHHRADWRPAPPQEFRAELRTAQAAYEISHGGWVVDGNYHADVADVLDGAQICLWLDYPRWLVMVRLLRRTLARMVSRRTLWNGNRENWRHLFSRDADLNILLWAWTTHDRRHEQYAAEATERWVQLRTPRETERWLVSSG